MIWSMTWRMSHNDAESACAWIWCESGYMGVYTGFMFYSGNYGSCTEATVHMRNFQEVV